MDFCPNTGRKMCSASKTNSLPEDKQKKNSQVLWTHRVRSGAGSEKENTPVVEKGAHNALLRGFRTNRTKGDCLQHFSVEKLSPTPCPEHGADCVGGKLRMLFYFRTVRDTSLIQEVLQTHPENSRFLRVSLVLNQCHKVFAPCRSPALSPKPKLIMTSSCVSHSPWSLLQGIQLNSWPKDIPKIPPCAWEHWPSVSGILAALRPWPFPGEEPYSALPTQNSSDTTLCHFHSWLLYSLGLLVENQLCTTGLGHALTHLFPWILLLGYAFEPWILLLGCPLEPLILLLGCPLEPQMLRLDSSWGHKKEKNIKQMKTASSFGVWNAWDARSVRVSIHWPVPLEFGSWDPLQ